MDQVQHTTPVHGMLLRNGLGSIFQCFFHKLHLFNPVLYKLQLYIQGIEHKMAVRVFDSHLPDILQGKSKIFQQQDLLQLQKFAQIYRYLTNAYVDEVDTAPVIEGAITGMLERLDPHSAYIPAEEMKSVRESFDGEFSGIGVEFNVLRDTVIVVNTIAGGPAERVASGPTTGSCASIRSMPWG